MTQQSEKLKQVRSKIKTAIVFVADALDTSFMSDAKSEVYQLHQMIAKDTDLKPDIRKELETLSDKAFSSIVGGSSVGKRAGDCLYWLGQVESKVDKILEQAS